MVEEQTFPLSDWELDDCWRLLKLRGVRVDQMPEHLAAIAVLAIQRARTCPEELSRRAWLLSMACEVSRDDFANLHQTSRLSARVSLGSLRPQVHTLLDAVTKFFDKVNRRS